MNSEHVTRCSREINRWSRAIRSIQKLDSNIHTTFPEPNEIEPGRKPYDLILTWNKGGPKLCKCIIVNLNAMRPFRMGCPNLSHKNWHKNWHQEKGYWILRTRVDFKDKSFLNLDLRVAMS